MSCHSALHCTTRESEDSKEDTIRNQERRTDNFHKTESALLGDIKQKTHLIKYLLQRGDDQAYKYIDVDGKGKVSKKNEEDQEEGGGEGEKEMSVLISLQNRIKISDELNLNLIIESDKNIKNVLQLNRRHYLDLERESIALIGACNALKQFLRIKYDIEYNEMPPDVTVERECKYDTGPVTGNVLTQSNLNVSDGQNGVELKVGKGLQLGDGNGMEELSTSMEMKYEKKIKGLKRRIHGLKRVHESSIHGT